MEANAENLKTMINLAYKESNPEKLQYIISLIYSKADVRHGTLTKADMEKLNKVSVKAEGLSESFSIGLIYNYIFAYHLVNVDSFDADFVLSITNVLLPLYEKLHGTILSRRILVHLKKLFFNLTKRSEVSMEDREQIHSILQTPNIKMDKIFTNFDDNIQVQEIKSLLESKQNFQKVSAVTHLMNLITDCSGMEEQLSVFYKKMLNVFKGGNINTKEHTKELLQLLGYFIDHMFFQCEYLLRINHKVFDASENVESNPGLFLNFETEDLLVKHKEKIPEFDEKAKPDFGIISYRLSEQEAMLKLRENIYPVVAFFINTFLLYPQDIEIQRLSINLLQRLYYGFPKFRKNTEDVIMSIFSFINQDSLDSNKKEASAFLYKLIHKDASPEFKQSLQNKDSFKTLYETPFYRPSVLNKSTNIIESMSIKELLVKSGFPQLINIQAGSSYSTYIEVWRPYSIIHWAFAIADYDILFSLKQLISFDKMMNEEKSQEMIMYPPKKIEASKNQYKGTLIAKDPGIYQLTFDNSGSWFNSKNIKYLVYVLEPEFDGETSKTENGQSSINEIKEEVEEAGKVPRKSSDIYESQDLIVTTALIHLDKFNINFKVESKYKSYEHQYAYPEANEEWNEINKEMLETTKKNLQKGELQIENSLVVKFIYNKTALKSKLFKENEGITNEMISSKLLQTFNFLEPLQGRIFEEIEVSTETQYITKELLWNSKYTYDDSVYVLCIENHSKTFLESFRKHNKKLDNHNFNNLCFPEFDNEDFQIKRLDEAYFKEGSSPERKLSVLTCLLINAFEFYEGVKHIIVFEDKSTDFMIENRTKLTELITNYLNQKKQTNDKEQQSERIIPQIEFPRVRLQEILNL